MKLADVEHNGRSLYIINRELFITKLPENIGDDKAFYLRVPMFYLPKIAYIMLHKYWLELNIVVM